jgi:hypothetical protein
MEDYRHLALSCLFMRLKKNNRCTASERGVVGWKSTEIKLTVVSNLEKCKIVDFAIIREIQT